MPLRISSLLSILFLFFLPDNFKLYVFLFSWIILLLHQVCIKAIYCIFQFNYCVLYSRSSVGCFFLSFYYLLSLLFCSYILFLISFICLSVFSCNSESHVVMILHVPCTFTLMSAHLKKQSPPSVFINWFGEKDVHQLAQLIILGESQRHNT